MTALVMQTRVWLLIPISWVLFGESILPLPVAARDLVVLFVFVTFLALKAMKLHRLKPSFGLLDFLLAANLIYLGIGFLRNPVGSLATNSDRVGGRPYFSVAVHDAGLLGASPVDLQRAAGAHPAVVDDRNQLPGSDSRRSSPKNSRGFGFLGNFYGNFASDTRLTGAELAGSVSDSDGNERLISLADPGRTPGACALLVLPSSHAHQPTVLFSVAGFPLSLWRCGLPLRVSVHGHVGRPAISSLRRISRKGWIDVPCGLPPSEFRRWQS